jgi:glycyl-tRNA synthetase beta chain
VLRARLSDAAFFYETDKHTKLIDRALTLKNILFQNKLGTLHDKTERVAELSFQIAEKLGESAIKTKRVAQILKADLTTQLVQEFPELQGIAGFYYALSDGLTLDIANAIKEHYLPRFAGDKLPSSRMGAILAIADRLDTIVGIFGVNLIPTGDKDPFGLRRNAIGILRILIENELNIDLSELILLAENGYKQKLENKNVRKDVLEFMLERLKQRYQEQNVSSALFISVGSLNITHPLDIQKRIHAVMQFKQLPEADALLAANKRVSNILAKYKDEITATDVDPNLFEDNAEKLLFEKLMSASHQISSLSKNADYTNILKNLATLRIPVDGFFDKVLVMTDDKARRENRLLLLKKLRELFLHVADVALIQ